MALTKKDLQDITKIMQFQKNEILDEIDSRINTKYETLLERIIRVEDLVVGLYNFQQP